MVQKKSADPRITVDYLQSQLSKELDQLAIWKTSPDLKKVIEAIDSKTFQEYLALLFSGDFSQADSKNQDSNISFLSQPGKLDVFDIHNTFGIAIELCLNRLKPNSEANVKIDEIEELWDFSYKYHDLQNIIYAVKHGYYAIKSSKKSTKTIIRPADLTHEALNNLLTITSIQSNDLKEVSSISSVAERIRKASELGTKLDSTGVNAHEINFGGLPIREAKIIWNQIVKMVVHPSLSGLTEENNLLKNLGKTQHEVIELIRDSTKLEYNTIKVFLDLLIYDSEEANADICVTPFVHLDDGIYTSRMLVTLYNLERNLLRTRLDRAAGGGIQIGALGEDLVAEGLLLLLSKPKIWRNIKLYSKVSTPTEIDLIAIDMNTKTGAIFEIKWTSAPQGFKQTGRRDDIVYAAQQKQQLRRERIESGDLKWPTDLPEYSTIEWHWFVCVATGIPKKPKNISHSIRAISLEYIQSLIESSYPPEDLHSLILSLNKIVLPPGWSPSPRREKYSLSGRTLSVDYIHLNFNQLDSMLIPLMDALRNPGTGVLAINFNKDRFQRYHSLSGISIKRIGLLITNAEPPKL